MKSRRHSLTSRLFVAIFFAICCGLPLSSAKAADALGHANIEPGLLYSYYTHSIEPLADGTILVGDPDGGSINEIIPGTFRINGTILPTSVTLLPGGAEGFTGPVYQLTFPTEDFIIWYYPLYDSTLHNFVVTAECANFNYEFDGQVMLRGHSTGDVNGDEKVNVADLNAIVLYMFLDGEKPRQLEAGDFNHNGTVNVVDLNCFVAYVFLQ